MNRIFTRGLRPECGTAVSGVLKYKAGAGPGAYVLFVPGPALKRQIKAKPSADFCLPKVSL